jgi:TonB-linked SusC/RagA family outer membrane protein
MRLTILFLFVGLMQVSASLYSQNTKLNLDFHNTSVLEVLEAIENQSEFRFAYSPKYIDLERKVDLDIKNKSIEQTLSLLFNGTEVNYSINDRHILLFSANEQANPAQQQKKVSGKVTDSSGATLPGVSVVIKGTTSGVISDMEGKYTLSNVPENAILQFSFVGMKTQEIAVGNQATINVSMEEEAIGIEEVIAIGYGTMKKSDLTGAVSKVSSADLVKVPVSSVSQALQGRVSGVRVINDQEPGGGSTIRIRGIATINNAEPLYVIDGFPTGGMNNLAPNDIQSVEVLKDASATAIYGSRGANGVVLITTKSGSTGKKPTVNANIYMGIQNDIDRYDMLDATEYAILYKESLANDGLKPGEQIGGMMDYIIANNLKGTDWQEEFIKTGFNQNYNVSVTGGAENSTYDVGATYSHETGIVKGGFSKKIYLHANNDYRINKHIKIGTKINYYTNSQNYGSPYAGISKEPMVPAWDSYTNNYGAAVIWDNPNQARILDQQIEYYLDSPTRTFNGKVYLELDDLFVKGLSFRSQYGADLYYTHFKNYNPVYNVSGLEYNAESSLSENRSESKAWAWSNYFTFNKNLDNHNLTLMLGTEAQKHENANIGATVYNVPNNENLFYISSAIEKVRMSNYGGAGNSSILSYFARANYNFKNRYLVTSTFRADGSSKFIDDYRWGYFPSFSLGWNMMEESFMDGLSGMFDVLKLRGGWGQVGNQGSAGNNAYAGLVYSGYKTVFGDPQTIYDGSVQLNVPNKEIHWEIAEQSNIGINFTTRNKRFVGSMDWFRRDTKDMIISKPIPYYVGQSRPLVNAASMRNSGIETELNYKGGNSEGLKYNISFNLTYLKNEVFDLPQPIMPAKSTRTEEGEPMAYFYGYRTDGIINDQAELDAYKAAIPLANNAALGDIKFVDKLTVDKNGDGIPDAGDGKIDGNDRVKIGNPWPAFIGGMNIDLEYKSFDFSLFFNGEFDKDIWNEMAANFEKTRMSGGNLLASRMGRWTPQNPNSDQPRMHNRDPNQNGNANDRYIEDGSFVRLTNAQIGYTFSKNTLKKLAVSFMRLYLSCNNVFTITNYSGFNPEVGFSSGSSLMPGFDSGTYPLLRTFVLGANIKF